MKAKFSRVAVVATVLIIALISLSGCVRATHNTEIDFVDGSTPYEIVAESVMPSVAIIEIHQKGSDGEFHIVNYVTGLVIDNDHILVNKRSIPDYHFNNIPKGFKIKANIEGADGEMNIYNCESFIELYQLNHDEEDIGLVALKLEEDVDNTRELVPCEFADSSELVAGYNTLAVSAMGAEYRVFEVLIANTKIGTLEGSNESGSDLGRGITAASMFTTGGFNHDDAGYKAELDTESASKVYKSSSAVLFNTDGKVVGFNYMMRVDSSNENNNVVAGMGYAIKANDIVDGLTAGGVIL